jgi:regulatory Fis family protein/GAF domain-containing protein
VDVGRRTDLIDQFADLVLGADDPRRLGERTIDVVLSLVEGRCGAVFTLDGDRLLLFASRGVDQYALDGAQVVWASRSDSLRRGEAFYAPEPGAVAGPKAQARPGPASLTVVPVLQDGMLVALLYIDAAEPHFLNNADRERLSKFARIIAKAVTQTAGPKPARAEAWETYLERTPVADMEREKLLLLLNRNEWNIARVARLMGVTRRTIYLRLQRHHIPRERVPKSRPRKLAAS